MPSSILRLVGILAIAAPWTSAVAQSARISEETRTLATYPFSEPNAVPILTRDARLYPYHSFEGYAAESEPREWQVIHLENDLIEVFVLPEAGGKIWGAVVKSTGHEFIYRNEVMKFRNIALRGPWTSGGIEFNFGVIGHTPATATPVDYVLRENPDGSVSCIVGTMDLPSRTHWRVEIRLPADRAYFETNVTWYNPTPLEQPYYNWMTAAALARSDLEMSIPGNSYLTHPGAERSWPVDPEGRYLPAYANNTFEGHKSYHVVGELNDFFGGYYRDDDYGFGHWARYEEMPGQKLWLWALSRQGGVWEDLLTDTDGQYVEYQAGRLLVQYAPGSDVNPITQASFDPGAADRWSETWFPLEGIGGLTDASRDGAMHVRQEGGLLMIGMNAFGAIADTLRITSGDRVVATVPIAFAALEPVRRMFALADGAPYRVELRALGLDYRSDPGTRQLSRPFAADPAARPQIPAVDVQVFEARELLKGRRYQPARELFQAALAREPWHREALLGLADLEYRRGLYQSALHHVNRALQLDAYDARANFVAGTIYRALDRSVDAREAFGWAVRSMAYRSVAYVQLAEVMLADGDLSEASRYAQLSLDYDSHNLAALQLLALVRRRAGDGTGAAAIHERLLAFDPLHHFVYGERYLTHGAGAAAEFVATLRSEYPDQVILELAADYSRRGLVEDARTLLRLGAREFPNPLLLVWDAWLGDDPDLLRPGADLTLVFPFRTETVAALRWAAAHDSHWSWSYLLALNLWGLDREQEAAAILESLGDSPDFAPMYVTRSVLLERLGREDGEADLRRAVELDPGDRTIRIHLVRYLQDKGNWDGALVESAAGRRIFPGDFNLALLHVRSLINTGRALEATAILAETHVLPSENSRESHLLYEQAHTLAALDLLEAGNPDTAVRHLHAALLWPESLGQGRPYEPEERVVQYLLGIAHTMSGDGDRAQAAFAAVVQATDLTRPNPAPLDLLAIPALAALGRDPTAVGYGGDTEAGRLAAELVPIFAPDAYVVGSLPRLASEYPNLFAGLSGTILLRALLVTP